MRSSNPFSIARNLFASRPRAGEKATRDAYDALRATAKDKDVFGDALYVHLDGVDPNAGDSRNRLKNIAHLFSGKLQPRGEVLHLDTVQGLGTPLRATGFAQVYKNQAGPHYHVEVANSGRLMRTEAEVRTHVLLESHLRHAHADPSIPATSVIDLEAPERPANRGFNLFSRLGKRVRRSNDPAVAPLPAPARAPVPVSPPIAAVPHNALQTSILDMFDEHVASKPLAFIEAMAKEQPAIAAYLALRNKQMHTAVGPELADKRPFHRSAYPGILVAGPGSSETIEAPCIRFESDDEKAAFESGRPRGSLEMHLLREDLEKTFAHQNRQAAADHGLPAAAVASAFPLGLSAAINRDGLPDALRFDHALDALSMMPDGDGPDGAQWRQRLTADHPSAAAFLAFVEEGLLIQGLDPEQQCERFHYVDDFLGVQKKAMEDLGADCKLWAPTFLAGIERNLEIPGDAPGSWRIRQADAWIEGCSKQEVLRHVMLKAVDDLNDATGAQVDAPAYPMCAYELLAAAIGKPVPQRLIAHEEAIVSRIAENREELAQRRVAQAEASRQSAIATEKSRQFFQEEYRKNHVSGAVQLAFCLSGLDPEKVTSGAIGMDFPITSTPSRQLETVRRIQSILSETHARQAISHKDENMTYTDNLCWLRSSWVSLLKSASPEVLAARLQEMGSDKVSMAPSISPARLAQIAEAFRANPSYFLHGDRALKNPADHAAQPARLGAAIALEQPERSANSKRRRPDTVESVLCGIQRAVAAGFRYENGNIMNQVEMSLQNSPLSSDMAMSLHRAFNVPALIIEVGDALTDENGNRGVESCQIRVAAPKGSALEARVKALVASGVNLADDKEALQGLLNEFSDLSVIWLEREHYDMYLSKKALGSTAS
jgi:hypothetical protein